MSQAKKLAASALAAAGVAFASSASALVANWTADFSNGFADGPTATMPVAVTPASWNGAAINALGPTLVNGVEPAHTSLRWGSANSGLDVTAGPAGVAVQTNQPAVNTVSITHLNNVIGCTEGTAPGGAGVICLNALKETTLLTHLTLTALNVDGMGTNVVINDILPLPIIPIQIKFAETWNLADPCGFPEAAASGPCRDIFVVLNPDDLLLTLPINFLGDGETYTVQIGVNGLIELSDEACARAAEGPGCVGVTTAEGGSQTIMANIRIFAEVPEPGSLAILALGLLGIGVVTRRKSA
jgi:hypothetical protein